MTTLTTQPRALPFPLPGGARLHGEVIAWACPGLAVRHRALVEALAGAGLDEGVARELAPRHAFARACRKLARDRIIRQVAEDAGAIQFQFTSEKREGDRFAYELETVLSLDKASGRVSCPLAGLAGLAQELLDEAIAARTGGDVTRIVQRLFDRQADLFPIRPRGGCYFVPACHAAFTDRVESFLGKIRGRLLRFPVPAGTAQGDRSVKEAVASGLAALIAEHREAVAGFGEDTRADTLERAAERIRVARHKVAGYAEYLAEERGRLDAELGRAAGELRAGVEAIAAKPAGAAGD